MTKYPVEAKELLDAGAAVALGVEMTGSYGCPNCRDLGAVMVFEFKGDKKPSLYPKGVGSKWLEIGDKRGWWEGAIRAFECPACSNGKIMEYLVGQNGLSGQDQGLSLANFKVNGVLSGKAQARDTAGSLLSMNRGAAGFYTFWGTNGCGKTYLLKIIIAAFTKIGVSARYITAAELLTDIRNRFGGDKPAGAAETLVDEYKSVRVLCLDEVDRVNLTDWAAETLFRLLDARVGQAANLATVLALNPNPAALPPEWNYLRSRMTSGVIVEVKPPDMRPAMGAQAASQIGGVK